MSFTQTLTGIRDEFVAMRERRRRGRKWTIILNIYCWSVVIWAVFIADLPWGLWLINVILAIAASVAWIFERRLIRNIDANIARIDRTLTESWWRSS